MCGWGATRQCEHSKLSGNKLPSRFQSRLQLWGLVWPHLLFSAAFQTWYFSLDSSTVMVSGYCGNKEAFLSITTPDNAAGLQFTFTKVEENTIKVTFKSLPSIIWTSVRLIATTAIIFPLWSVLSLYVLCLLCPCFYFFFFLSPGKGGFLGHQADCSFVSHACLQPVPQ